MQEYKMGRLIDSLHGGVRGLDAQIVDIVWEDVDQIAENAISVLIYGIDLLNYVLFGFTEANWGKNVSARLLLVYQNNRLGFDVTF
ncbi:MAG: hypothetical protein AAF485_29010 [Chloroflexota bacterium]